MKNRELRVVRLLLLGGILGYAAVHWLLPFFLPFLIGWSLAALAEPQIRFLQRRLRLPRGLASALAVSAGLVLLAMTAALAAGICYRQAAVLVRGLPQAVEELSRRSGELQRWLLSRAVQAPASLSTSLSRLIREFFAGGSILVEQAAAAAVNIAGRVLGGISGGALLVGTAVLSSYLISARYPQLHRRLVENRFWMQRVQPVLHRLRSGLGDWVLAQMKLSAVTFGIVCGGLLLLRAEQPILWAAVTATVDAVPMFGSGTVLLPMALLSLVWGNRVRGIGLVGIYVTAMVTRSALEPRMLGKQLGISPLMTLVTLYVGFRIWGILGMLLAPVLAVGAVRLASAEE